VHDPKLANVSGQSSGRRLAVAGALTVAACALHPQYMNIAPATSLKGTDPVVVAVIDRRPEVVSGEREPTFLGISKAQVGIPYPVNVSGGRTLAGEIGAAACRSLVQAGYRCVVEELAAKDGEGKLVAALQEQSARRALLFTIDHWRTDAEVAVGFFPARFDLSLAVRDGANALLARARVHGEGPPAESWDDGPRVLEQQLGELLRDARVVAAMHDPAAKPLEPAPAQSDAGTATPPKPDVEERLMKLKDLHDKGLITDPEYDARRKAILDAL
jgi:hypothetical protein